MIQNNPNIITKIEKDHKFKNGVLIQCFPGQGLVGRIAGMHLIEYFNAKEDARIYSSYFPHLVIFNGDLGKLVHAELWVVESTNPPLVILTGESQPQEGPQGMFEILLSALDIVEKWGINKVIAIGGFVPADYEKKADVTGFVYTEKDAETLKQNKIELFNEGRVSGAVAVITALASERGLESFGIMGKVKLNEQTPPSFNVDPIASKNVLKVLKDLLGFEMDLSKMDEMISEIEDSEAKAIKAIEELNKSQGRVSDRRNYYL